MVAERPWTQAAVDVFDTIVRARRSTRAFLPDPVPSAVLQKVFELAGRSPSNCNSQPWRVEVVSGASRDRISAALLKAGAEDRLSPDFPFDETEFSGVYGERRKDQGGRYYRAAGIERDDLAGRNAAIANNLRFYGAPHAAFLLMPMFFGGVRVAADIGMYAQTLLLALEAYGISSCPQTILGFFARTVREELGIEDDLKLLFGVSIGYEDKGAPTNDLKLPRAALVETTRFHT